MSHHQKFPFPPFPYPYAMPYLPSNLQKTRPVPQNLYATNNISNFRNAPPDAGNRNSVMPKMYNPFYGPYPPFGLPGFPPFGPAMPGMRYPPMFMKPPDMVKTQAPELAKPLPFLYNCSKIEPDQNSGPLKSSLIGTPTTASSVRPSGRNLYKQALEGAKVIEKSAIKRESINISSETETANKKKQVKTKEKQAKHAKNQAYDQGAPKKKAKLDFMPFATGRQTRETREKKQSIDKIMSLVMKERLPRDRVIRIGREFQAQIPESFVNQYEYNLKIKLEKKKNLLNRLKSSVSFQITTTQ